MLNQLVPQNSQTTGLPPAPNESTAQDANMPPIEPPTDGTPVAPPAEQQQPTPTPPHPPNAIKELKAKIAIFDANPTTFPPTCIEYK